MVDRSRTWIVILSVIVAAGAMLFWTHNFGVSLDQVRGSLQGLRWPMVAVLFVLLAVHVALASLRWSLVEAIIGGTRPAFGLAFATGAVATGLSTVLPAPLVSIASRAVANRLRGKSGLRGTLSGTIDQMCDLSAVLLVAAPAALAFARRDVTLYLWGVGAMILLGFGMALVLPRLWSSLPPRFHFLNVGPASSVPKRQLLLSLYGLSLLRVANLTVMTLAIHGSLEDRMAAAIIVGVPLLTLAIWAAMLPGGFGISEWSFSVLFLHFGVQSDDIVHFVVANRIIWTGLSIALALLALLATASFLARRREGRPS